MKIKRKRSDLKQEIQHHLSFDSFEQKIRSIVTE